MSRTKGFRFGKTIHQHRSNKRRFDLKHAGGLSVLPEEWEELKRKTDYSCACCFRKEPDVKLIPDHIEPLSLGGINEIYNIQPLCGACNSRKRQKVINYLKMNFDF